MSEYNAEDVRNIALVGHAGCGKTTLVEALLAATGVIAAPGSVARGTTVCDFDPLEKELQHSLDSAITSFAAHGKHINLIDTPGYPDFLGRAISVLPAVETAALVINAQAGVESVTQRMWKAADNPPCAASIIVNQIDAPGVDLADLTNQIRESFGPECLPINLPADGGTRVIDCFFQPSGEGTDFSSVAEAHGQIIDQVVEVDEELMELYLEQGQDLQPEQLHDPFEAALREAHLIPICYCSAQTGAGIPELIEILVRLMPNPAEGNPPPFMKGEGAAMEPVSVAPDPSKHALAHCLQGHQRPLPGQARHLPHPPGAYDAHEPALDRRCPQALQAEPPVSAPRQRADRGPGGGARGHPGGGPGGRDPLRRRAARLPRRGPSPPHQHRVPGAPVRARRHTRQARRRAEAQRRPAQAPVRGPLSPRGAPRRHQRDHHAGPGRAASEGPAAPALRAVPCGGGDPPAEHPLSGDHHRQGRGASPPQEADRRRRPVRRGLPAGGAYGAGGGVRVRGRHRRRLHPRQLHPVDREGGAPGADRGCRRRLPHAGRQGHRL
jgi:small GTP-binding protein